MRRYTPARPWGAAEFQACIRAQAFGTPVIDTPPFTQSRIQDIIEGTVGRNPSADFETLLRDRSFDERAQTHAPWPNTPEAQS